LEKPQYNTIKPKVVTNPDGSINAQATFKDASLRQLGNSFVEMCKGMLRSSEGSKMMMSAANYDNVKLMSRVEQVLYNPVVLQAFIDKFGEDNLYQKLTDMGTKKLEKFYAENDTKSNPFGILAFLDNQKNLMDGMELISVFAVIASRHQKLQHAKLSLHKDYHFKIDYNGKTFDITDVHPMESPLEKGLLVSKILAELQTASPDNGKDPCLGDIGANPDTADFLGYLGSLGIPVPVMAAINAFAVNEHVEKLLEDIGASKVKGAPVDVKMSDFALNAEKLVNIQAKIQLKKQLSESELKYLAQFRKWYINAQKASKDLASFSTVGRSDSQSGAIGHKTSAVLRNQIKIRQYYANMVKPGFAIIGLGNVVDDMRDVEEINDSPVPHLQADFTYGVIKAQELAAQYLPDLNENNIEVIDALNAQIAQRFDLTYEGNDAIINQMLNALKLFKMSIGEFIGGNIEEVLDRRNFYIHDFPMQMKMFLAMHKDIRDSSMFKSISLKTKEAIRFTNVGGVGKIQALQYQQDANNLLLSKDDSRRKFIQNLFYYSVFNDGLNFGQRSISRMFDIGFANSMVYKNEAGVEVSFNQDLKKANAVNLTPAQINNFVELFLLNNPKYIPVKNNKNGLKLTGNQKEPKINWETGEYIIPVELTRDQSDDVFYKDKKGNNQKLFRIVKSTGGNTIFRFVGNNENGDLVYQIIESPDVPFYHMDGYSKEVFDQLQDRGATTKLDSDMVLDYKENQISDAIEDSINEDAIEDAVEKKTAMAEKQLDRDDALMNIDINDKEDAYDALVDKQTKQEAEWDKKEAEEAARLDAYDDLVDKKTQEEADAADREIDKLAEEGREQSKEDPLCSSIKLK
jgi:hypothetical protein